MTIVEVKKPARVKREEELRALSHEELIERAIYFSQKLRESKSWLRVAVKTFRWVQKPNEAQDIERFLDTINI